MAEVQNLEELIDYAIDPNNLSSNVDRARIFADQVNKEIGGPYTAMKLLTQKLQLRQEVITLQALNVIECCVKNCGEKFHKEVGKYKFINELIKMLSPKYDADITPPGVKDRVTELMYAWYCGLPHEKKIGEAYKMLKQQGIVKRDPVNTEQAETPARAPQNTVFEDKENSQLLSALLASQDPEDLQSANKLIKSLVQQEEDRLDRVSKRIQELETVNNNVRLLDEMLSRVTPETLETDKEIMNDLYESCLKMRPELFRLASRSAEDKDDSMDEILVASDELTRVVDLYKEVVLLKKFDKTVQKPYNVSSSNEFSNFQDTSTLLDLGADTTSTSQPNQNGFAVTSTSGNTLLDEQFKMLGLDTLSDTNSSFPGGPNSSQQSNTMQSNMLPFNFNNPQQATVLSNNFNNQPANTSPFIPNTPVQQPLQQQQPVLPLASTGFTTANQGHIGAMRPEMGVVRPNVNVASPNVGVASPNVGTVRPSAISNHTTPKPVGRRDVLDFNVFDQFKAEDFKKPPAAKDTPIQKQGTEKTNTDRTDGANQSAINFLIDISENENQPSPNVSLPLAPPNIQTTNLPAPASHNKQIADQTGTSLNSLLQLNQPSVGSSLSLLQTNIKEPQPPVQQPIIEHSQPSPSVNGLDKSTVNVDEKTGDNYFVPLEALKPDVHQPIAILDKDNIKSFLNIATDTRPGANQNVIVTILSTISMNGVSVTDFSIQVAVPKTMRVKLQPATSNVLSPFNPIMPPSSITQVMLIANPAKESIRLRFKISYTINGVKHVENSSINQLPVR